MKTLFVAINAKYIHTNLAVRYMHELAKQNGYTSTEIAEYTINQRLPQLLRELYLTKANHMIFSCYIWNIDIILDLCCQLKQVMPNIKLLLAGPEVSYNSTEVMEQYTFIDDFLLTSFILSCYYFTYSAILPRKKAQVKAFSYLFSISACSSGLK